MTGGLTSGRGGLDREWTNAGFLKRGLDYVCPLLTEAFMPFGFGIQRKGVGASLGTVPPAPEEG